MYVIFLFTNISIVQIAHYNRLFEPRLQYYSYLHLACEIIFPAQVLEEFSVNIYSLNYKFIFYFFANLFWQYV